MKRIMLICAAAVVVGAGGAFYWWGVRGEQEVSRQDTVITRPTPSQATSGAEEAVEQSAASEPAQPTESTTLAAVGSYTGSATATRTTSGSFVHTVTAQLGAPADGDFYEGWLVVPGGGFVSTGKLNQENGGEWSLSYTSDQDLAAYTQVVITEETGADGLDNVPEDHVLEGSF
ncbi:hypothetical protein CR970_02000 [Candidatus Saccharibacteria bacterium]|nr:MAG: hypothetical protein CR970_02000 [Candidatus Saccharibacteria bacterium]